MTNDEILKLYKLQSHNVRNLNQVQRSLVQDINYSLRRSNDFQVEIKTKLLALLYCAWSEAQFIQIVYTPIAFSQSEIENINRVKNTKGISEGWKQMIELALQKVGDWNKSADLHNRRKKLFEIIDNYIKDPSLLRNKIAHGQWFYALNKENNAENPKLTKELEELDSVQLIKQFEVHKYLGLMIRDLVQSPKKGFHKNYWVHMTALQEYLDKTKNWTIVDKKSKLLLRPINPQRKADATSL